MTAPRGAWVHLFADAGCGHGCRVLERHGAIVGRSLDVLTVQLYDFDVLDGRVPRPIPGAVLRLEEDELATLGAAVYASFADARLAELEAVARGLGHCGHGEPAPSWRRRPEQTRAELEHDDELADLGVLSRSELTEQILAAEDRGRR